MASVWEETVSLPAFPALSGDARADVLVIGGGMAGLLCARLLTDAGANCLIAEANRICGGVTKNTTAKITSQHGLIYAKLLRAFGPEKARMVLLANEAAISKYKELCARGQYDFEEKSAFVYSLKNRKTIDDELNALNRIGYYAEFADALPLPLPVKGAAEFFRQAQFHPLKFARDICGDLCIFENTSVDKIEDGVAVCRGGRIRADHIIVATHFPFLNLRGGYFLKLYQHRSYGIALERAPDLNGMYVDEAQTGLSFRNYENLLLLVGGGRRTGKNGGGWNELSEFARARYPGAREAYRWAAQDCMTLDGAPYIGQYAARAKRLYVATGFCKWGMTGAMAAAMMLTDNVLGRENPFAPAFSPARTALRPQLAVNAFEAVKSLLTPTKPRCPHLGCALKWNTAERTWDCPCHGSRFTREGQIIDNPATGDCEALANPRK